jgi:mannose PTS system EIIA component
MIGMVLVTHGELAIQFKLALEHVVGPQEHIETITIGPEDDMDLCRSDIMDAVKRANTGQGVVVLTDMFGGTPSNLALSCMNGGSVEVVAGINLPMLIKLASVRGENLHDAVRYAKEAGQKYITVASHILAGK